MSAALASTRPVLPTLGVGGVVGLLAAASAGVAIWLIGLPDLFTIAGTSLRDLSVPVALLVAGLGALAVGGVRSAARLRVVDIVVAGVLGVVGGVVFIGWNATYAALFGWVNAPFSALYVGMWLFPAVLAGLVVRKPGAALFAEVVAASVSLLAGSQFGFAVFYYGLVQGIAAEAVFAVLLYRRFGVLSAIVAGAAAGAACGLMDVVAYAYAGSLANWYLAAATLSGAVIAGLGSWVLTRGLARTGALVPLASGRQAERV